jgi:hypothetical protein
MTERGFIDMPARIAKLPVDKRGFPVPKFVTWFDGQPDFRVIRPSSVVNCVRKRLCWICGEPIGVRMAFVIGPMCAINRISSEPPSHKECAVFAARNCPFLSTPLARRREKDLPEERYVLDGHIDHNPGVAAVWITKTYTVTPVDTGYLFKIGTPLSIAFYCEGRLATRAEIDAAIDKGLPFAVEVARQEGDFGVLALTRQRQELERLLDNRDVVEAA